MVSATASAARLCRFKRQILAKQAHICRNNCIRGYSTVGSAIRSQRIGQGFESPYLHQTSLTRTFIIFEAVSP